VSGSPEAEVVGQWVKYAGNPVLGGNLGTCFDMSVLVVDDRHRMWFSWRPKHGIGYAESTDGLNWEVRDEIVLGPAAEDPAEQLEVTRPFVLDEGGRLTMWYAAHGKDRVVISRASSPDGVVWQRHGVVLAPASPWEKSSLMCPSVLREETGKYHMWYSGGERYEPDAIGYATSPDGSTWTREQDTPVLAPGAAGTWESDRVAGAHVFKEGPWLYAAYIGFANGFEDSAIGIARSRDGVTWDRHLKNPVITHGQPGQFDSINVYKPFVVVDGDEWRMWFNGSSPVRGEDTHADNRKEQIGYASCRFRFQSSVDGKGQALDGP
jgi:predicted GH43/DUF377 family glycosyl hydrolase